MSGVRVSQADRQQYQRPAVTKLRAAGSEGWAAAWPLDVVSSEGRSGAAPFSLPRTQQTSGSRTEEGDQQHHQQHGDKDGF